MAKGSSHSTDGKLPSLEIPARVGGISGLLGIHPFVLGTAIMFAFVPAFSNDYWTFNVTTGLILAMACLGLLVVVGWGREISLAQAGLTGAALYISGFCARGRKPGESGPGLAFPIAAAIGIAFVVGISILVALVAMRLSGVYVVVLTLSLQFLLENSLFTKEKLTGGLSAPSTPRPNFFGMSMEDDKHFYFYIYAVLIVSMMMLYRFRNSRFGRSLIMVGSDKAAAAAVGVSPWMYKVTAFAISGLFAGLAGALSAPLYRNPPGIIQYISFNSLFYLAVPILAGFESLMAVVLVSCFFQLLPQVLLELKINVYLLGGLGLTVGVLAGPRGLSGFIIDLFDPRARARRRSAKGAPSVASRRPPTIRKTPIVNPPPGGSAATRAASSKSPVSVGSGKK